MSIKEEISDVTLTALKPILVVAVNCARYFAREDQSKEERVRQSVQDVDLVLKALGIGAQAPAGK